jgi:plastocyanin
MHQRVATYALLALGALTLAACGASDGGDRGGPAGGIHEENRPVAEGAREIEVSAGSFEFSPDEISLPAGEDVAIVLESEDSLHDFQVEGVGHVVSAVGNEAEHGGLRIDEPGEYDFWCTVSGHRSAGMEGTILVE